MIRVVKKGSDVMSRLDEIKRRYEQEMASVRREQADCTHVWGEVIYDPEIVHEPKYEPRFQGSDCFPELVGNVTKKVDRWSRTCKKCGKVEYTKAQRAVKYEPNFDG